MIFPSLPLNHQLSGKKFPSKKCVCVCVCAWPILSMVAQFLSDNIFQRLNSMVLIYLNSTLFLTWNIAYKIELSAYLQTQQIQHFITALHSSNLLEITLLTLLTSWYTHAHTNKLTNLKFITAPNINRMRTAMVNNSVFNGVAHIDHEWPNNDNFISNVLFLKYTITITFLFILILSMFFLKIFTSH